jgi:predicted PurR-regulated permease PerM
MRLLLEFVYRKCFEDDLIKKMTKKKTTSSPLWNNSTKIIINVLILVIILGLLIRFSSLVTPLVIALLLALLFHPIAEFINVRMHVPWNLAVNIIFLITVVAMVTLLTIGGFALIEQIQGLIIFLQKNLPNLPNFLTEVTSKTIIIGPFPINLTQINWTDIGNQLINYIQPLLAKMGDLIGSVAGGAASVIATIFFALILSYLITIETGGSREKILILNIPGYQADLERMGKEISLIWNAFLKGQAIIIFIRTILYSIILGALGVHFYVGLAIGAGIANLIPYLGVTVAWITYFFVALLQGTTIFGLDSFSYALLVTGLAWFIDNIYDNTITPRVMGGALKLHPAAIMVAAIVGLNLFGLMGMFLAAPVLASLKLVFQYIQRKMQDKDPWQNMEREYSKESDFPLFGRILNKLKQIILIITHQLPIDSKKTK